MPRSDTTERPLPTDAQTLGFTPSVSANWFAPIPLNIQQALDGLAVRGVGENYITLLAVETEVTF